MPNPPIYNRILTPEELAAPRSYKFQDLTGKRYDRLIVVSIAGKDSKGRINWLCACDCGNEVIASAYHIKNGDRVSCGCKNLERLKQPGANVRHTEKVELRRTHPRECSKCKKVKSPHEFQDVIRNNCRTCVLDSQRRWRKSQHDFTMWRKYGLKWADYQAMHDEQGGVCAICHKPSPINNVHRRLAIDHDDTKKKGEEGFVRGLLCHLCNTGIGSLMHDVKNLANAIKYLEKFQK